MRLDVLQQRQSQSAIETRAREVASRYLKDSVASISSSITPNNYVICKQRLLRVIQTCRDIGFGIPTSEEESLVLELRNWYEKAVRVAFEREEQSRIKAQIRDEQMREREIERELKQLEREREAIQTALQKALADTAGQHSEEIDRLKLRLAEAEAKSERTVAQAQLTKAGFVYVISNIGAFGDGVFKIGMTRRLEPLDRIRELGDASVPFPFDVHMMISCDDAPSLENAIHRAMHTARLNRINLRKEFFRVDIEKIHAIIRDHRGSEIEYVATPDALQYRQSLEIAPEDVEFIEHVYEELEDKTTTPENAL